MTHCVDATCQPNVYPLMGHVLAQNGSGSSDPIGLVSGDFHDGTEETRECLKPSTVLWKIKKIEVVGVV